MNPLGVLVMEIRATIRRIRQIPTSGAQFRSWRLAVRNEIVAASDRVAVMRDRRKIGEIAGEDIKRDNIIRMIAGEDGGQH